MLLAGSTLSSYDEARQDFSWAAATQLLSGLPEGRGLNIAYEAVDRHVATGRGGHVAVRTVGRSGTRDLTYRELSLLSNRFANLLHSLDVGPRARVFTLLGRQPELYVAALGCWKNLSVLSPLFAAFGPEPIRNRLTLGDAQVLVTTTALYRRKIAPQRDRLHGLRHVLLIDAAEDPPDGTLDLTAALASQPDHWTIPATSPEAMALLHFTSGTTGTPKGAVHVHDAVVAQHITAGFALDLRPDDVFWCTADPGWVTGTSYGIIAPLTHGVTLLADDGDFDANRWYQVLADHHVTVWYTAPTALRMLMRAGAELASRYDLSALRHIASVGEPLNPEVVVWAREAYGIPVHDNWWQTETGAIMISNYPSMPIRPGSMGRPMPGIDAAVLRCGDDGRAAVTGGQVSVLGTDQVGELALRPGWPSMFRAYLHDDLRYRQAFAGGWYLTGDLARVDADGYFWFVGRADDVIKSSGHLVGPFEVESALLEHPAVTEAGVIGVPDEVAGEIVKAFVTLRPGYEPDDALRAELIAFGRRRLGAVAPRDVAFDQHLPHTSSGKVMRRLLKARELGLPEGDLSTLERPR
ncbi:acetate--CoA ligase [Kribbella solani]|uniref:acetate--CoA ligase n=1 Tax=Kribbella solani TaxID=236067 RepID=A0A841DSW9_9ACTN|nr:acetate--CoA ligase [Kribbella solani]MBB5978458.1 acetyl-CoA synthetase [Kribbella solani]